jgi:hypothetical protein
MIKNYQQFNEAYYNKNYNLWKVAKSTTPILGEPVFVSDDQQNFFGIRRKLQDNLKGYQQHMDTASAKMKDHIAKSTTKGERDNLEKANQVREKAFDIVNRSAKFMEEFNKTYDSLKEDLFNEDHVKVAKAIIKLNEIKPNTLIKDAGVIKRMNYIKLDSEFIKSVLKWVNSISQIYDVMDEAAKTLGKSKKQVEAARKQSFFQKVRWGM